MKKIVQFAVAICLACFILIRIFLFYSKIETTISFSWIEILFLGAIIVLILSKYRISRYLLILMMLLSNLDVQYLSVPASERSHFNVFNSLVLLGETYNINCLSFWRFYSITVVLNLLFLVVLIIMPVKRFFAKKCLRDNVIRLSK